MIETFYGLDALHTPKAFLASLLVGIFFGFALERAGFGSSRKLTGVFYFRDMAVFKVMFTALITAMLGLSYCMAFGWIQSNQIYLMPTVYGAQIVGGLIFGVGFVMGGWCPGTAAAGVASGKLDALVFLGGSVLGSILFSEAFPLVKGLYEAGNRGVVMAYDSLGMSRAGFVFVFSLVIVAAFWGCELVERKRTGSCLCFNTPFMRAFSVGLLVLAAGLFLMPASISTYVTLPGSETTTGSVLPSTAEQEKYLLSLVDEARDHIEPEDLADRLMLQDGSLTLVDVRPLSEYNAFHIKAALNVPLADLAEVLAPRKNQGLIVLYSNGMTHPAQARDSLSRLGYENVYILTDGLTGFMERCLKPASLRSEPLTPASINRVNAWRAYFLGETDVSLPLDKAMSVSPEIAGLVETDWLAENLNNRSVRIIDLRSQPEYNTSHLPGSVYLSIESFRGVVGNLLSMLLPRDILARHFSLIGILPTDLVVFVPGDKPHDATLAGMVCNRLGHTEYAILYGGFGKWAAEQRPLDTALPGFSASVYPVEIGPDNFTLNYEQVLQHVNAHDVTIIDVRPAEYFQGTKSDEARAGHIPGAVNRPYTEDVAIMDGYAQFKPVVELAKAYGAIVPSKDSTIIVHCRTGHQGSQAHFVLTRLLGYRKVYWYDGGWSEWAARKELPVERP